MRKLTATPDGAFDFETARVMGHLDLVRKLVTGKTAGHEAGEFTAGNPHNKPWTRLVRDRIKLRHDDKRGPISATLPHAVY